MRRRFFVETFQDNSAVLRGDAAHHLGRVLRAEPGQLYELSDGAAVWLARVERVARKEIRFTLLEPVAGREPDLRVTLLLSIVKFDRFECCLEKATELGVAEIVPLAAARSEKSLLAAAAKRAARWQTILLESAQQSRRLRPPQLRPVASSVAGFTSAGALLAAPQSAQLRGILLSERPEAPPLRSLLPAASEKGPVIPSEARNLHLSLPSTGRVCAATAVLAIGPEGGWTDAEIAAARAADFAEASLGETILRTETAVISALAVIQYALGDFA